ATGHQNVLVGSDGTIDHRDPRLAQDGGPLKLDLPKDPSSPDSPSPEKAPPRILPHLRLNATPPTVREQEQRIVDDIFLSSWDIISKENLKLLDEDADKRGTVEKGGRYLKANGFQFCGILNNATFDSMVPVSVWEGQTVSERDRPVEELVELIDGIAQNVMSLIYSRNQFLDPEEITRFACYCAADGANTVARLSDTRLLHSVNAADYFSSLVPAIVPAPRKRERGQRKRFYKLAYLITVRGEPTITANVKNLIEELDDGSAIILIHVDSDADKIYEDLQLFTQAREDRMRARLPPARSKETGNVHFSKTRFRSVSKHISLLWIQLNGYWELLDLAYWDHVVNLSALDVPLRKSREVQRLLGLPENRGLNFISHWADF
ncbi:hypothetical protein HDU67_003692, partial [Dinochytrium kinnereticum]